ncbi:BnaC03g58400D [Brassica napus]|uniref:BnaC03g58400D protein n=1 Tax=Brassica napus TaxID=3708 RepID=A0A078HE52_BRANA|nr:BnaC03g58400D [Brassica napus]
MRRFNWVLRSLQARRTFDSTLGLRPGSQKPFLFERYIHATGISFSSARNYYDVLGVSPKASREEIKKSFHELAKKFHPDTSRNNPSAKKKFQEIREAYETLGNSERREEYDKVRYRNSEYVNNDGSGAERFRRAYQSNFSDSFHKIFSEIFEDQSNPPSPDIRVELTLSLYESLKGCTKRLEFDAYVFCDSCGESPQNFKISALLHLLILENQLWCAEFPVKIHGLGHSLDAATRVCPTCRGLGRVTIPPFTAQCQTCKGSGHIVKEHCMSCRGSGVVEATKTVEVVIPAGMESGASVTIDDAGHVRSRTSRPGKLYIKFKVANDSTFSRDGSDIYVDANISFTQAILGGKVVVPTLSGKTEIDVRFASSEIYSIFRVWMDFYNLAFTIWVTCFKFLQIPKGAQPGELLILRGKGLPKQGFFVDHGDQYVRLRVSVPTELNERQRAILEEFAKEEINSELSGSAEGSWPAKSFTRSSLLVKLTGGIGWVLESYAISP